MPAQIHFRAPRTNTDRFARRSPFRKPVPTSCDYWGQAKFKVRRLEADMRSYAVSVEQAFRIAARDYPAVSVRSDIMMGAPCVSGTRIPIYTVLEAVEHYGELRGAIKSYPRLTLEQVKDAIGFAKSVIECPLDDEIAPAP